MKLNQDLVRAVVFDMDGLLIDSEPCWQAAEKRVFEQLGIPLTHEQCLETQGLRIEEVVQYWAARLPWPESRTYQSVVDEILDEMEYLIAHECKILPGALEAIQFFDKFPVALASSSPMRLINAFVDRFNLRDVFRTLKSAEFEKLGKPYPGVYLTACAALNVPAYCALALEDSINGVLAARAAQMQVVAIPEAIQIQRPEYAIAHGVYSSLPEFLKSY